MVADQSLDSVVHVIFCHGSRSEAMRVPSGGEPTILQFPVLAKSSFLGNRSIETARQIRPAPNAR